MSSLAFTTPSIEEVDENEELSDDESDEVDDLDHVLDHHHPDLKLEANDESSTSTEDDPRRKDQATKMIQGRPMESPPASRSHKMRLNKSGMQRKESLLVRPLSTIGYLL